MRVPKDHALPMVIMWAGLFAVALMVGFGVVPAWAGAAIAFVVNATAIILNGLLSEE